MGVTIKSAFYLSLAVATLFLISYANAFLCDLFGCNPQIISFPLDLNLSELGDANISSPSNSQVLTWNSTLQRWQNQNSQAGGGTRTYTGIAPVSVDNDNNKLALNVQPTSDWNGTFDGYQGTDLNRTVLDVCAGDANSVWTSANVCQNISNFNNDTITTDSTIDTNSSAFTSVQADLNAMYCQITDTNNTGRLSYLTIADPPWISSDKIRTYTGISPVSVDSDNNKIGLNVLAASDWNGTLDGLSVGTSGAAIPNISAANFWTGIQRFLATVLIEDDNALAIGSSSDVKHVWETTGNDNYQIGIGIGAFQSGYMSIMESTDMGDANRSPLSVTTNPKLRLYSSDENAASDYIEFFHNQTNAVIKSGAGDINLSTATKGFSLDNDLNKNVLEVCNGDTNSVWTSANVCQSIAGFDTGDANISHNDLNGIQGGNTGQYYHLNYTEYTDLNGWLDDVNLGTDGNLSTPGALSVGSTPTLFVDSVTNRVGIGTSHPSSSYSPMLHILDANDSDSHILTLQAGTTAEQRTYIRWNDVNGDQAYLIGKNADKDFVFYASPGAVGNHFMKFVDNGTAYINSAGNYPVKINSYQEANTGKGGLWVGDGQNPVKTIFRVDADGVSSPFDVTSRATAPSSIDLNNSIVIGAEAANATYKYLGQLGFLSDDPDFNAPKMVAYIGGEATETYDGDTKTGSVMRFYTGSNGGILPKERMVIDQTGAVRVWGSLNTFDLNVGNTQITNNGTAYPFSDLNKTVLTACAGDANSVWTSANKCQSIAGFDTGGAGTTDTTIDTNQTAFTSVQADLNVMYCQIIDTNNTGRLSYLTIADPPWTSSDKIRTYTGISPVSVNSDTNKIGLNVLANSDWNGTLDGLSVGTSGAAIPALNAINLWTATQEFDGSTKIQFDDAGATIYASASKYLEMDASTQVKVKTPTFDINASTTADSKVTIRDNSVKSPLNVTERSTAPTTPAANDIYLDDGTNTTSGLPGWRRYTGADWEDISAIGSGTGSIEYYNAGGNLVLDTADNNKFHFNDANFNSNNRAISANWTFNDDKSVIFGTGSDSKLLWETTAGTDFLTLLLTTGYFVLMSAADVGKPQTSPGTTTNPTIRLLSDDENKWVEWYHNQQAPFVNWNYGTTIDFNTFGGRGVRAVGGYLEADYNGPQSFIRKGLWVNQNQDSDSNASFRVSGTTDINLFYVNPSTEKIGIGTGTPSSTLTIDGGSGPAVLEMDGDVNGGCLKVKDSDGGGWTYLYALDGTFYSTTTPCG